jgi:hypothetical protein
VALDRLPHLPEVPVMAFQDRTILVEECCLQVRLYADLIVHIYLFNIYLYL